MASANAKEKEEEETLVHVVPQVVAMSLIHFYDTEGVAVGECSQLLQRRVFPSQDCFQILWRLAGAKAATPFLFNTAAFRDRLQRILTRALAYMDTMNVVVFWFVRDVGIWLRQVLSGSMSGTTALSDGFPMPFGVLEAHEYELEVHRRTLSPQATKMTPELEVRARLTGDSVVATEPRRFGTYAYTGTDFQLVHLPRATYEHCFDYVREYGVVSGVEHIKSTLSARARMPASRFFALMAEFNYMRESRVNLRDADWARAHPRVIVQAQPPSTAGVPVEPTDIGAGLLYSEGSVFQATQSMMMARSTHTLAEAERMLERMRMQVAGVDGLHGRVGARGGPSLRQRQRERFAHPDDLDDMHVLPEIAKLVQSREAVVLDNAAEIYQRYRMLAAGIMGVPIVFLSGSGHWHNGPQFNRDVTSLELLEETIARRRSLVASLYEALQLVTFGAYDMEQIDETAQYFETEAQRRLAQPMAKAEAEADADEEEAKGGKEPEQPEQPADAAGALVSSLQVTARRLRDYLRTVRMLGSARLSSVQLVFRAEPTQHQLRRMEFLSELFYHGAMAASEFQPFVQELFGDEVRMRDLPVPPTAAPMATKPPPTHKRARDDDETNQDKKEAVRSKKKTRM
jgi:hypothetical protein